MCGVRLTRRHLEARGGARQGCCFGTQWGKKEEAVEANAPRNIPMPCIMMPWNDWSKKMMQFGSPVLGITRFAAEDRPAKSRMGVVVANDVSSMYSIGISR